MRITLRARARNPAKIEFYDENNKLVRVLDSQEVREINPIEDKERFKFEAATDNLKACEDLFKCGYDKLEKIPFYLPVEFMDSLNELITAAHKKGIAFEPYTKILRSLYREGDRLRVQLRSKGENIEGILKYKEIFKIEEDEKTKELAESPGAKIISKMLEIKGALLDFNEIAAEYYGKKDHSIKDYRLKGYAHGHDEPSNWVIAVALEVLHKNKVNVFSLGLNEAAIKEIWLKSNKQDGEARFKALFKK